MNPLKIKGMCENKKQQNNKKQNKLPKTKKAILLFCY
jgi:hypothetical protein